MENDFLKQLQQVIEGNIADENFGVSELSEAVNMSRSNLLRKVKKLTGLSVSQFIRQVRLKKSMEMLKLGTLNVSEVSYAVGFGSTSYFVKCFREFYGFPPGEASKRQLAVEVSPNHKLTTTKNRKPLIWTTVVLLLILTVILFIFLRPSQGRFPLEKSIAILPFKNDSNDSSNVYLINGLMESTLNNLQKIKDLRVISRTSSEKYRNSNKSIPEIAQELNVSYFVEGSGQKIGDKILLNVQLIDASSDRHLWSKQYSREATSIFDLQQEVAKSIAEEIQVIITPEEHEQIDKIPTDNLEAYDYFLKGYNLFNISSDESLRQAIPLFKKAIELDKEFALAHAVLAMNYYYLDIYRQEKEFITEIDNYSGKALLYDPKSAQSLMSKALYYIHSEEYNQAIPYLEKALEYNPNSAQVINMLSDFYATYSPNTEKYLEYALKGIQLNVAAYDSVTTSYIYLHLSNALIQTGFVEEALFYVDRSLDYNPHNLFSNYVKAYMLYAKNGDLNETIRLLVKELKKDTSRLDILQDVAKAYYYKRDFDSSYYYYKTFMDQREAAGLDIYRHQHSTIAYVLKKVGLKEESEAYFADFKEFADHDQSIYKDLLLSAYYAYQDDFEKSLEHLELFSHQDNYMYWIVLFVDDPMTDKMEHLPEFKRLTNKIDRKFWDNHKRLRASLEEKGLINAQSKLKMSY